MSIRTIALTLRPSPEQEEQLCALQAAFNAACNYASVVARQSREFRRLGLQELVYRDLRERFGLLAQLAVRVIAVVADSYRVERSHQHTFRRDAAVVLNTPRLYRIEHNRAGISTLAGRIPVGLNIGGVQRRQLAAATKLGEADLVRDYKGRWRLLVSAHYADPPLREADEALGVDLGRTDIAATSDGDTFSGGHIRVVRDRYARRRTHHQKKASQGTRSSRRRCRQLQKRLAGRERRFQRDQNHIISKAIVARASESGRAVAVEDLTGIRERTNEQPRCKAERRRSNSWAFYQLRGFVANKAQAAGVPFVMVPPRYTSQTCHACLHLGERSGKRFVCPNPRCHLCGLAVDADINGARVIARLGAAFMRPSGPWLSCALDCRASANTRLEPTGASPQALAVGT
jgi:IS605 OrfB family transposase